MKRALKLFISILFFAWCRLDATVRKTLGKEEASICVVLCYHGIGERQCRQFEQQMREVRRLSIPMGTLLPLGAGGNRYTVVTFDDGFVSTSDHAVPILKKYRIPAIFFIPVGYLGRRPAWDRYSPEDQELVMSAGQLRQTIERAPKLIELGSHTVTHPILPQTDRKKALWELCESKRQLAHIAGYDIETLALPYGEYDEEVLQLARRAGYRKVFSISPALADAREFLSGRVRVEPTDWPLEFRLKLLGAYRWIPMAKRMSRIFLRRIRGQRVSQ